MRLILFIWLTFGLFFKFSMVFCQDSTEISTLTRQRAKSLAFEYYEQAVERMDKRLYGQAIDLFTKSVNLDPLNGFAHYYKGICLDREENETEALVSYNRAVAVDPELGEFRFNRGVLLYKFGKYEQAIEDFQFILDHPGTETQAVYYRSVKYGDGDEEQGFSQVLTLSKINADVYNYIAMSYQSMQDFDRAVWFYQQAIVNDSSNINLYINKAQCQLLQKDTAGAIADFEMVLKFDPENELAAMNLSLLEKKGTEEIIEKLSILIEKDPGIPMSYQQRAYQYYLAGQYDSALADYSIAISIEPNNVELYADRALVYEKLPALQKALMDYDLALSLNPIDPRALRGKGNVFFKTGDFDNSVIFLSKAINHQPDYAPAYYNRALAYFYLNDLDHACADMKTAIDMGMTAPEHFYEKYCGK